MILRGPLIAAVALLVAGCGSAGGESSTDIAVDVSVPKQADEPSPTSPIDDDVVESIDELTGTFWQPVSYEGEATDPADGEFWEFFADGDTVRITGFAGCNGFSTSSEPGALPPRLDDGVLRSIQLFTEQAGCADGVDGGAAHPRSGDLLRLVDGGDRLKLEADGAVRVELERVTSDSATGAGPDDTSFSTLNSFSDIVRAYWGPVEQDGEPLPPNQGAYWRLGGQSRDVSLSGFDGCNHFRSAQVSGERGVITEGVLRTDVSATTERECDDVQTVGPRKGDTFEISDDGSRIRVSNGAWPRIVLELVSEQPLGDGLRPEEMRAIEEQMEAEERADAERIAVEEQADIDQLRLDLDAARARWTSAGIEDYVVDLIASCLACASWPLDPLAAGNRYTVVVEKGVGSGPWADSTVGASVDDWFEYLDAHLLAGGSAEATFDVDLGYPTSLFVGLAGPTGADEPVGVDEAFLGDVMLTPSELFGDDLALIGQLVTSRWLPVAPHAGDVGVEGRQRHWKFSTLGPSFIVEGVDGCNAFGGLVRLDDEPGQLVDGVLYGFDPAVGQAVCPEGVVRLPGPLDGDLLAVTDDGGRLDVIRDGQVLVQFVREL